jgi:arylsulfatase A-like enzyme
MMSPPRTHRARPTAVHLALILLAASALRAPALAAETPAHRPNILFILADDLGYGDLGCYGHPRLATPVLDRLAAEGVRFTQYYANHSTCSPTRAAFVTGRNPSRDHIYAPLSSLTTNAARRMPDWLDVTGPTLPRALQQAGYRTAHFGKWHLGGGSGSRRAGRVVINHPSAPPVAAYGFEVVRTDFGNGPTWRAAQPVERPHELYPYNEPEWQTWSSRAIADATIAFLEDHAAMQADRPFYVNVWLKDPHTPLRPTDEMRARYRDLPEPEQSHYAMVSFMDQQIGRVLDRLGELGLADDTLVVFSSDNGAPWGRGGSNGALRGWKWHLYEGGIRVPLITRWPAAGPAAAGRVDAESVLDGCDLVATFLRLAGAEMGRPVEGTDATAALRGRRFVHAAPMMWHHPMRYNSGHALAIREGPWKLLMDPDGSKSELYDLTEDPAEQHNLASRHPGTVGSLREKLSRWYAGLPPPLPPLANHEDPALRR